MTHDQTKCEIGEVKRYALVSCVIDESIRERFTEMVLASDYDALRTSLAKAEASEAKAHELRNQIAAENKRLFAANLRMRKPLERLEIELRRIHRSGVRPPVYMVEEMHEWAVAALTETPND